jgi:uncharacterized protein
MLLLEGLLPLIHPKGWRDFVSQILARGDGQIRFYGLLCVLAGSVLLLLCLY